MQGPRYVGGIDFMVSWSEINFNHPDHIMQDLNCGSGGKYIYPVKQWTFDPNNAITGFAFIQGWDDPPPGFTKLDQDLNEGAGGEYNYLCIRKGAGGKRVTDISFISFQGSYDSHIYEDWWVFPQDLNTEASTVGEYIYLVYKTE